MMTALLSVGAWAENLWNGTASPNYEANPVKLTTASLGISMGDILTFTITATSGDWPTLQLCQNDPNNQYWPGSAIASVGASVGTVSIIVNEAISTAAVPVISKLTSPVAITSLTLTSPSLVTV